MTTYSSQPDGVISADEPPYLRRRAAGGIGTIMTAACSVHPTGWAFRGQWQCSDDRYIESLRQVADAIHEGGGLAVLQIHHGGRQCPPDLVPNGRVLSASAVAADRENAVTPHEMRSDDIDAVIDAFGQATRRAAIAGFDGVEIHGANTYLLQQFVSPHSNRRADRWGADRLAFSRAVTEAVLAERAGMIVGYRFSPEEPHTPGITLEHTAALIDALVAYPLDFLHVSLRDYRQGSIRGEEPSDLLRAVVGLIDGRCPLIGVGGVKSREDAESVLAAGCDLVAIGRTAISEPEWGVNAAAGVPIRTKLPAGPFAESLTVPAGLAAKIDAVPGWFERDSA